MIDTDRTSRVRELAPETGAPLRPAVSRGIARWLALGPMVLLAGSALAVLAFTRFDGLYGQDSFAYFHYATGPLRQSLERWQLPPPFFWPPGYPLLVAAVSAVVGVAPIAGQVVSVAAGAAAVGIVVLAPTVVPAVLGLIGGGNAPFAGDLQVYSWSPLNALRATFTTGDGQLAYSLPTGLYYALAPANWWYFSPLVAALIAPGVWAVVRQRRIPALGILVAWAGIVLAFHAGAPWQNPRFALAYLPPLAILAAVGYDQLRRASHVQVRRAAAAWLLAGLALTAAGSAVVTQEFIERKQNDVAIVRWADGLAPTNGQLLAFGLTATSQEYGRLQTLDLSEVSTERIRDLLGDGRPTLVLVDVNALERQWTGRAPWERYHAMLAAPGLTPLGTRGGYTLFVVRQEGA